MNVSTINKFFRKVGEAQIRFRWPVLLVFVLATAICCAGLSKFKMVNSSEGWYGKQDELKITKDKYESIFGNQQGVAVLVSADDVFSEEVLLAIEKIGNRMREIPFANELFSLVTLEIPVGNEEGYEIVIPFDYGIPSDKAELEEKRALIMRGSEKTNSVINSIVSDDCAETWITLSLLPYDNPEEDDMKVGYALHDILTDPEFKSENYKLYGSGIPYSDAMEEIYEYPDYMLRVILGFAAMLLFLVIFVRSFIGVVVPALATVGAIASVFGLMAFFGDKADAVLVTLPVLLGMALSVGYAIHYINMFKLHFRRTGKRIDSVVKTIEESSWAVFFTVLTTVASLVSFALVDMKPIAWVGRTCTLVVLAVYFYIAVLVPIFLSFGKDKAPDAKAEKGATKIDMAFSRWADVVQTKRKFIIAATAVIFALCIPGICKIQSKAPTANKSSNKLPHIAEQNALVKKKLGNQFSYTVMIDAGEADAFKERQNMEALEAFEDFLGTLSLTKISGGKPRVSSVTEIIKEMNRALNSGLDEFFAVPDDDYLLAQIMELSSIEMHKDFALYMSDDFNIASIDVDMTKYDSFEAVKNINAINEKLAQLFPNAECRILGDMIENAIMESRMVSGELKSFGFSFVIIAVMLILAFASLRTGLIGMIPNVAPVILIGAIMGYFKFPLDFSTMTIMPMILGIAVDDTIHLTTHLKYGLEQYGSYKRAMETSFREIGKSMFSTTFILCSIFAVYMFSPLNYIFVIGLLSVIGLASALVADYTVTPALLYAIKPFGKEKE